MNTVVRLLHALDQGAFDARFAEMYGSSEISAARVRLQKVAERVRSRFGNVDCVVLSAPGRTEIIGNHTDHNGGHVLAAAVQLDLLAVACTAETSRVELHSDGFPPICCDLCDLAPRSEEHGSSAALIRGVAAYLAGLGYRVGGFCACVDSRVPVGSGLSSSAAFEVLVGQILNVLYNDGRISTLSRAQAALHAENEYFGKPCGFMDQLACAEQGLLCIDFDKPLTPDILPVDSDFADLGMELFIVNAGGSHVDLTPEYAAIPFEMRAAARVLGQERARGITLEQALDGMDAIRKTAGDRAFLRLLHFITEDRRVLSAAACLAQQDRAGFLALMRDSGLSSWRLLQNCQVGAAPAEQPVTVALAVTEAALAGRGACRVHGGGFAGTIQVFAEQESAPEIRKFLEHTFGREHVMAVCIRRPGLDILFDRRNVE